jgi:hypothetical protein
MKRRIFLIPRSTYSKKSSFISQKGQCLLFWNKKSKMEPTTQYFGKRFFLHKKALDFHLPSKILSPHIWASKSLGPSTQTYKQNDMYVICRGIRRSSRQEDVPNWHIQAGRRKGLQADSSVREHADSDMRRYSRHDRQSIKRERLADRRRGVP